MQTMRVEQRLQVGRYRCRTVATAVKVAACDEPIRVDGVTERVEHLRQLAVELGDRRGS